MARSFISDVTTTVLGKSLDIASLKQRVVADNIANVETPGFKRSEVTFVKQLKQALETRDSKLAMQRVQAFEPEVEADYASPSRPDGNNVSIDKEMAELTKTSMEYEALVRLLGMKFNMLQTVITEGKR